MLLTNIKIANLRQGFANYLSTDIKLSKFNLYKIVQSGGFLGRLLGPLVKPTLLEVENVLQKLAESVFVLFILSAAASLADARIHKKVLGSGTTLLIISNKGTMKIFKSLENSCLLLQRISETIQNESKERNGRFLSMLLGRLDEDLLRNMEQEME